uniref:Uncharacterized protein n=1 Tax=Anopheles coluzzii TaxID=1518534 RepID=A0A8W7PUB0_ANOCL
MAGANLPTLGTLQRQAERLLWWCWPDTMFPNRSRRFRRVLVVGVRLKVQTFYGAIVTAATGSGRFVGGRRHQPFPLTVQMLYASRVATAYWAVSESPPLMLIFEEDSEFRRLYFITSEAPFLPHLILEVRDAVLQANIVGLRLLQRLMRQLIHTRCGWLSRTCDHYFRLRVGPDGTNHFFPIAATDRFAVDFNYAITTLQTFALQHPVDPKAGLLISGACVPASGRRADGKQTQASARLQQPVQRVWFLLWARASSTSDSSCSSSRPSAYSSSACRIPPMGPPHLPWKKNVHSGMLVEWLLAND